MSDSSVVLLDQAIAIIKKKESDMMWAQGESPRPADYSEGHYTGWRKGLLEAVSILEEVKVMNGSSEVRRNIEAVAEAFPSMQVIDPTMLVMIGLGYELSDDQVLRLCNRLRGAVVTLPRVIEIAKEVKNETSTVEGDDVERH